MKNSLQFNMKLEIYVIRGIKICEKLIHKYQQPETFNRTVTYISISDT